MTHAPTRPTAVCAYCRKQPIVQQWRPFCSKRCKMADLGRWLNGDYRVPSGEAEEADDDDDGLPARNAGPADDASDDPDDTF